MQTFDTEKKDLVNKVFEDVFHKYDLMNDLMSLVFIDYGKEHL